MNLNKFNIIIGFKYNDNIIHEQKHNKFDDNYDYKENEDNADLYQNIDFNVNIDEKQKKNI